MKEKDWLTATTPEEMFAYLEGKASDRKTILFTVACARRVSHLLTDARCRKLMKLAKQYSSLEYVGSAKLSPKSCRDAIDMGERSADELVDEEDLHSMAEAADAFTFPAQDYAACYDESSGPFDSEISATGNAAEAASYTCRPGCGLNAGALCAARAVADHSGVRNDDGDAAELEFQCRLLRELFGNPFRRVKFAAAWRTSEVVSLAQTIYKQKCFDKVPTLGMDLVKAGCDNQEILMHCRQQQEHVRGCWVVDLLLGNK